MSGPENNHRLNHHGSSAEDFYINGKYAVEYIMQYAKHAVFRLRCRSYDTGEQSDKQTRYRTYKRYQHCISETAEQLYTIRYDNVPNLF